MNKKREIDKYNDDKYNGDNYDYLGLLNKAASPTDCTGLIPALPEGDAEVDYYNDLYPHDSNHFVTKKDNDINKGSIK